MVSTLLRGFYTAIRVAVLLQNRPVGPLPNFGENVACLVEYTLTKEQLLKGVSTNADSPTLSKSPKFASTAVWQRTTLLR